MRQQRCKRSGISLLEVLAALAIFFLSMVVIMQMVESASHKALRSQRLTRAALLTESKMAELVAGILPQRPVSREPLAEAGQGWFYTVHLEPEWLTSSAPTDQAGSGLSRVQLSVFWSGGRPGDEVAFSLTRLVLDPGLRRAQRVSVLTLGTTP